MSNKEHAEIVVIEATAQQMRSALISKVRERFAAFLKTIEIDATFREKQVDKFIAKLESVEFNREG